MNVYVTFVVKPLNTSMKYYALKKYIGKEIKIILNN